MSIEPANFIVTATFRDAAPVNLSMDDIAASIRAAGYAAEPGLKQLGFAFRRALDHKLNPPPAPRAPTEDKSAA